MKTALHYASPALMRRRHPDTMWDWLYAALVGACYALAFYAEIVMPGGYGWGSGWEVANFMMTVAALSATTLFLAGLWSIWKVGRRHAPVVAVFGTVASGLLPILMLVLAKRWLQNNFA